MKNTELKKTTTIERVFQMSFDISESKNTTNEDRSSLFDAISNLINNFYDSHGNRIDFDSIGCENVEDMSQAYRKESLNHSIDE